MTALHLSVPFIEDLPPVAIIVEQLSLLTEEAIYYEEARWQISCPTMQEEFGLYPGGKNEYILTSFALKQLYLVDATLVVLQTLGGTYPARLAEWAKQPWRVARRYY